jgi:hypothetical protein
MKLFKRTSSTKDNSQSPNGDSNNTETTSPDGFENNRKLSVMKIFKRGKEHRHSSSEVTMPEELNTEGTPTDVFSNEKEETKSATSSVELTAESFEPAALCEPVNIHQKYYNGTEQVYYCPKNNEPEKTSNATTTDVAPVATPVDASIAASASSTTSSQETQSDNLTNVNHVSSESTAPTLITISKEDKKWIQNILEFAVDVGEGDVLTLCRCSAVSRVWYSVAAGEKFWQPLVEHQMRERGYSPSTRKSARSKYLAMINKEYEITEPESDEEGEDGPLIRVRPKPAPAVTSSNANNANRQEAASISTATNRSFNASADATAAENTTSPTTSTPTSPTQKKDVLEPINPAPYYSTDYRSITYKEDPEENIEWALEDGKNQIECATLNKLVEMLTHHKEYDAFFTQTFILTFRSFTDQKTLIDKLVERFNIPPPRPDISFEEFAVFKKEKLDKIRLRVTSTFKYWLESFYLFDFADEEMIKRFEEVVEIMDKSNSPALANMLRKTLEKVRGDADAGKIKTAMQCPEILKIKKSIFGKKKKAEVLHYPLLEVARQMALIDFEIFAKIEPKECLNQSWNKEYRVTKAPNINHMIQDFNKLSNWVGSEIVKQEELDKRARLMEKFIDLAGYCFELNNFNGLFSVISGLNLASVFRLKNTWAAISEEHKKKYEDLNKYISRDFNFRALRTALKNVKPPCIPYIGLYLTDLTFIEEGNPKYINQKINFVRCRKFAEVIRDMQTYQNTRYALLPYPELQEALRGIQTLSEEEMYQQSLKVEARQKKKKKP